MIESKIFDFRAFLQKGQKPPRARLLLVIDFVLQQFSRAYRVEIAEPCPRCPDCSLDIGAIVRQRDRLGGPGLNRINERLEASRYFGDRNVLNADLVENSL